MSLYSSYASSFRLEMELNVVTDIFGLILNLDIYSNIVLQHPEDT